MHRFVNPLEQSADAPAIDARHAVLPFRKYDAAGYPGKGIIILYDMGRYIPRRALSLNPPAFPAVRKLAFHQSGHLIHR